MTFRTAQPDEADSIAHLHTESWQTAYRGILTDDYLDGEILDDRLAVWRTRFTQPAENQHVIVAVEKNKIHGFVSVFGNDDAQWGALIDNLHVKPNLKGKGIGKNLMQHAALWVQEIYPKSGLYLWVFQANHKAIGFYETMGGENVECVLHDNPDGGQAYVLRYVWTNLDVLINS